MSNKQIWFFDDDNMNAPSPTNSKIKFIKVTRTSNRGQCGHDEPTSLYFSTKLNYGNLVSDNKPVPISGITSKNIMELRKAILKQKVEAVVFDWDKTLLTRSMWFPDLFKNTSNISEYKKDLARSYSSLEGIEKCSDKEVAHFFFHNPNDGVNKKDISKRSKAVADILHHLQNMNIPIYILTNNLGAIHRSGRDNRDVFTDMLTQIGVSLPKTNIIYNALRNKEQTIMKVILPKIKVTHNKTQKRKRKKHTFSKGKKRHTIRIKRRR
jgi:hypothetical protein